MALCQNRVLMPILSTTVVYVCDTWIAKCYSYLVLWPFTIKVSSTFTPCQYRVTSSHAGNMLLSKLVWHWNNSILLLLLVFDENCNVKKPVELPSGWGWCDCGVNVGGWVEHQWGGQRDQTIEGKETSATKTGGTAGWFKHIYLPHK